MSAMTKAYKRMFVLARRLDGSGTVCAIPQVARNLVHLRKRYQSRPDALMRQLATFERRTDRCMRVGVEVRVVRVEVVVLSAVVQS